mgnify:CR=1 FL=1
MAPVTAAAQPSEDIAVPNEGEIKELYEVGEIPPLGHVPKEMYAWAIRRERHGPPEDAMKMEVVPTPEIDNHEVLIRSEERRVGKEGRSRWSPDH